MSVMTTSPAANLGDPATIPVSASPAAQLYRGTPGSTVLVYNADLVNTAYVGYSRNLGPSSSTAVQPLSSVVVDGSRTLYGVCPTATVILNVTPGGISQAPSPAQIAAQISALGLATLAEQQAQNTAIPGNIATTGVPLLVNPNLLDSATALNVPANGQVSRSIVNFTQPSYDIVLQFEIGSAVTEPWLIVNLVWTDPATTGTVSNDKFLLGCNSTSNNMIGGRGPAKAYQLQVFFTNPDPAAAITIQKYSITQHSIPISADLWKQQAFTNGISGLAIAPYDFQSNLIVSISVSVAASSNNSYGLPLYTGNIFWQVAEVAAASARLAIRIPAEPASGGLINANNTIIDSGALAANAVYGQLTPMPRQNCQLEILNTNAAAQTITVTGIGQEPY